jgi:hypothetical protein
MSKTKTPEGKHGDIILVDGGWSPISLAIKRRLATDWSHVGIIVDEATAAVCAAHAPKFVREGGDGCWIAEALPGGFCLRRSSVYAKTPWRVRTHAVDLTDSEQRMLRHWCGLAIGTPYDWPGVLFGHISRNSNFAINRKYFCSEATAEAMRYIGREVISQDIPSGLIPPHFFAVTGGILRTTGWHIREPRTF